MPGPYSIVPINAPALVFTPTYTAKTQPRILRARRGGKVKGEQNVVTQHVTHPGVKAREFTNIISGRAERRLTVRLGKLFKTNMEPYIKVVEGS